MIVYKRWALEKRWSQLRNKWLPACDCDGWFLFGFIPLYVRRVNYHS